jgi:hypothetical protein
MLVVVFPSPALVGLMAVTRISRPLGLQHIFGQMDGDIFAL